MSLYSGKHSVGSENVQATADEYGGLFDASKDQNELVQKRKENYTTLVNHYYDLVTDFFEYGWGKSFHFAPMARGEAFDQAIAAHEHFLALRLKLGPGMKVLDVGCGVGGPLMEIARFSRANITGVNNNDYQIARGQKYVEKAGLKQHASFLKADFMNIPQPDNTYDAAYAIEATVHAPSKTGIYGEIFRLIKPGGYFAAYEWVMTDKYDPSNAAHIKIKRDIEIGDGIPNLDTVKECIEALQAVGFEVIEHYDLSPVDEVRPVPWYRPLEAGFSWSGFKRSVIGIQATHYMVAALEKIGLAPKGSLQTHTYLESAATGLVKGGQAGIFTPMFYFLVRKPENKNK